MNGFIAEIYSQPDVILETLQAVQTQLHDLKPLLTQIAEGRFQKIVFTGMGSSCSAVYPSQLRLLMHDMDVRVVEASELLHYQSRLVTSSTLLVAISQSGRSAELMPLLDLAQDRHATVLGITNTPDSILDQRSDFTLLMKAGAEATVSTKTYTCTVALLHLLTSAIIGTSLAADVDAITPVAEGIRQRLGGWQQQMASLADQWGSSGFIEYLARGHSMASANTAALISKESIKMPTESMNAGQFRHGPLELVDEQFTGMLFMGGNSTEQVNLRLAKDILDHGGQLTVISQKAIPLTVALWVEIPTCSPELLPLAEIVPVQLFCAELSVRRGYEAGAFRYISKVTVQE